MSLEKTNIYDVGETQAAMIEQTLIEVIGALEERGYNAINQIVGYLMSGDPGYISNHLEARTKIIKIDRAKLIEVLLKKYLGK